jgi:hypothetical protein
MALKLDGTQLSGTIGPRPLDGTLMGNTIRFALRSDDTIDEFTGTVSADGMSGTLVRTEKGDQRFKTSWSAKRVPARRGGPPQRHEFVPTAFHRQFSAANPPVLHIWPGDTVHTTTVDAAGVDEKGVSRVLGGNPETGPFFVETAMPGDVLVVRLNRVRQNRDWAISDDGIVGRALDPGFAVKMKDFKNVRWRLIASGLAMLERRQRIGPTPIRRPMLGCVAVAPGFGAAPSPTGDSGRFGQHGLQRDRRRGDCVSSGDAQPGALPTSAMAMPCKVMAS